MVLYLRCVWANKFTLAGYVGIITSFSFFLIMSHPGGLWDAFEALVLGVANICAGGCVGYTLAATNTLEAYKRTRKYLGRGPHSWDSDIRFARSIGNTYCWRKGYELAIKDANAAVTK